MVQKGSKKFKNNKIIQEEKGNKLFYYSKYAKQWSKEKYDKIVVNGYMVDWTTLKGMNKIINRINKKVFYWNLKLGLFDFKLWIIGKKEKYRRWRKGDITHKNF